MKAICRSLFAVVLAASLLAACGPDEWRAQPANAGGVIVEPVRVWLNGGKLWFRTIVHNNGPLPIIVNRDAVTLTVPTGQTVQRTSGSFGGIHVPYIIPPGGSHQLYTEFFSAGFRWRDVPQAQLNLQGAITVNGAPIAIPPMMVAQ